ncbi:reverse transcriptase [Ceratobasidium theobromae]|uniref:Reverse transcriptase n=1 Tax=Ceratobasidium theobromae TaxID=1582974 RepID=A0A5N5Q9I2_9AGAM|nr:reverse transcriptase [Ceratobasidium theobromae]
MSAIANTQPPAPPVEIPPDAGGTKNEDSSTSPAATVVAPGGLDRTLPAPSPDLRNASDQFLEETFKDFMVMNREVKEKKRKKGLKVETQGSPLIPVPISHNPSPLIPAPRPHNPSRESSPSPPRVSLALPDPITHPIAPLTPLPGTNRPTPFPHSPLPSEADEPSIAKKVAESMLDIATKDILDRLTTPVVLNPPGDEKLALPQLLGGPWDQIRVAMRRRAACPYAKAGESALSPIELRLWGDILNQVNGFASEVSDFLNNFHSSPHRSGIPNHVETTNAETITPEPAHFAWSGDDITLAMQSAVFAITREFMTWEQALQRASDFDAAHKQHHTPPEGNALGLTVQAPPTMQPPPTTSQPPLSTLLFTKPASPRVPPPTLEAGQATRTSTVPVPPPQAPIKTWVKVAAPKDPRPTPAKGTNPPILNTSAIQKELSQIKASKAMPTNTTDAERDEDGWNVQRKGKKTKTVPAPTAALPAGVIPLCRGGAKSSEQGKRTDLEVAFKPKSPLDVDLVKARANPNESCSCLMWLLKHCNELTSSKEYKDKTDIRTTIKEVELFAPGLCGVMGLRGTVMVQCTSGWTRMRILHFLAWATDPDTSKWLDRINTKEEILSILQDFAPRELLTRFPPVDVCFFKPDAVVGQCQPGGFETIVVSVDDPTGEAYTAYSNARLSFGYRNSFVSLHTTCPKIAECKRCCSYQCAQPQACSAPMRCYKCGERHDPKNHDSRCSQCWAQKLADKPGHVCTCAPRCANCKGAHVFGNPLCLGRLKFAAVPAVPFTSEYAPIDLRNINPPGGTPWSQASMCTPPMGVISPKVQIDEDEAMPPPLALAENGLISREIMQVNVVKSNTRIHALLASPDYNDISILIVSDPWWGPIGTTKHDTNDQHRLLGAPANPLWRCFAPPIDTQNPASPPSCIIVPVYLHGPKHAEAAEALFQLPMIETPTLVCGDFNIQHPEFVDFPGAKVKTSALGCAFTDWLLDSNLHVLNDLHCLTREPRVQGHAPSIIDFTIANGALFSMDIISDWDSSFAHSLNSDHAAIFFTIHAPRVSEHPTRQFRFIIDPLMEDDWIAAFEHRVLEVGLKDVITCPQEVEELASGLLSACTWATEAVMECRPTQCKAPRAPWWNEDCSAACGRVVTAKEEGMDRDEIRARTSHLWYCIRKAKRSFFDEICSTARPDNIWGINQWYRGWKSYGLPTLRGLDGSLATTNSAKAELLHNTFFPYTPATPAGLSVEGMAQNAELPFPTISRGEIADILASCSNKSAPGDLIEVLYNAMLSFEYHPVCLKNALIAPILKPNKFDFASPKVYRPISLLEILSKLFEKIMVVRFTTLSGLHGLIPPEQFRGKDMTSCMDAGLSLIHDIESSWAARKQASITLLDISGYFNNIDHDLLVSYLSDWMASFRINDEVGAAFELRGRGIPQGSPLLPVFSSIFTAPMLSSLRARGVQVRAYIDDLCIFKQGDSQESCIAGLLEGTRTTLEALTDMGLSAERSKTKLIHFAKNAQEMTKNLPLVLGDKAEDIV